MLRPARSLPEFTTRMSASRIEENLFRSAIERSLPSYLFWVTPPFKFSFDKEHKLTIVASPQTNLYNPVGIGGHVSPIETACFIASKRTGSQLKCLTWEYWIQKILITFIFIFLLFYKATLHWQHEYRACWRTLGMLRVCSCGVQMNAGLNYVLKRSQCMIMELLQ